MQERQQRLAQLIEHLLQEGWTKTTLSEALGVDFTTVYRWVKGKAFPETDSKNFLRLAKLSGGDSESLQLYLNGEISLLAYRQGQLEKSFLDEIRLKKYPPEKIKKEVLEQIYLLDPVDIADIIKSSAAFLAAKQA